MAKSGIETKKYLGVGLTQLKKYALEVKQNANNRHQLALDLWDSGFHDAKILATYIDDPKKVLKDQIIKQITDIDYWDLGDKLVTNIVLKTKHIKYFINKWKNSDNPWIRRSAFVLLAEYAYRDKNSDPEFLKPFLTEIEEKIYKEENWVKEGMLYAVMYIGSRSKKLNKLCIDLGKRLKDIKIDYGETKCETPKIIKHMTKDHTQKRIESFYNS
ncbi:MAG: DNA alkylation repair protein [Candidatus Lokiarchaeota archaeon]|nr:DNA alkylation repair protein [Candidatus Lokiarchaeota archaeon]